MRLLQQLCSIHAPSGNENAMTDFILDFISKNKSSWKVQPQVFAGTEFQNCVVLIFGKPQTAVYAHLDNIGFTARYKNQLVKIGGPHFENGAELTGADSQGKIECEVFIDVDNHITYKAAREIERGTDLSYKPNWREDENFVQCCYMDNRLGVWNALQLCETIEHGAIVFSCWEEHGGGSVPFLSKFLFEKYSIRQSLISDITWITEGVHHGDGVVISMRDTGIPRRSFVNKIILYCKKIMMKRLFILIVAVSVSISLKAQDAAAETGKQYMQLTTVESVLAGGVGRSRMIITNPDGSQKESDLENLFSVVGINFKNIKQNEDKLLKTLKEYTSMGWKLDQVTSLTLSQNDTGAGGIFMTRYLLSKTEHK